jgi:hypothetical protein
MLAALRTRGAPLLVALIVSLVFLPALGDGFVDWDDETLLVHNLAYRGLGWSQIRWLIDEASQNAGSARHGRVTDPKAEAGDRVRRPDAVMRHVAEVLPHALPMRRAGGPSHREPDLELLGKGAA